MFIGPIGGPLRLYLLKPQIQVFGWNRVRLPTTKKAILWSILMHDRRLCLLSPDDGIASLQSGRFRRRPHYHDCVRVLRQIFFTLSLHILMHGRLLGSCHPSVAVCTLRRTYLNSCWYFCSGMRTYLNSMFCRFSYVKGLPQKRRGAM